MTKYTKNLFLSVCASIGFLAQPSTAGEMDCAVILCMGGHFAPAECQPAFNYMMARITPIPSLPPFGVCEMTGANGQAAGELDMSNSDLAFLDKIRVYWWHGRYRDSDKDGESWNWTLRSCLRDNETCQTISSGTSLTGYPQKFTTDTGTILELQDIMGSKGALGAATSIFKSSGRAFTIEYSDWQGDIFIPDWQHY